MPASGIGKFTNPTTVWGAAMLLNPDGATALTASLGHSAFSAGLPALTAAAAYKVALNLDHVVDVRDHGADPTGVADSTAAIQAAETAAGSGGMVYFPKGSYLLSGSLATTARAYVGASRYGTKLIQSAAGTPIFVDNDGCSSKLFRSFALQATADGVYGFSCSSVAEYWQFCTWDDVEFYKDLERGISANLIFCHIKDCRFGYLGVIRNTIWTALYVRGQQPGTASNINICTNTHFFGDNSLANLANALVDIQNNAALWEFHSCDFEGTETRCFYGKGIYALTFQNCWFEPRVDNTMGYTDHFVYIGTDGTMGTRPTSFRNCWFYLVTSTNCNHVVNVGNSSSVSFYACMGNLGGGYYTKKAAVYDDAIDVLLDNACLSYGGTKEQTGWLLKLQPDQLLLPALATPPASATDRVYQDTGVNTRTGVRALRSWDGTKWADMGWTKNPYHAGGELVVGTLKLGIAMPSPIGYWACDDNAASAVVVDSAGSGYDLTAQANTDTLDTPGVVGTGTGLTFNGASDYLIRTAATFTNTAGTIAAWVNLSAYPASRATVFSSGDEAGATKRVQLYITAAGLLVFRRHDGSTDYSVTGDTVISTGEWHHVAVTSDDAVWALYVDGKLQTLTVGGSNNGDWFGSVTNRDNITVGVSKVNALQYYLSGAVDDVRVYAVALTAAQVKYLWGSAAATFAGLMELDGLTVTLGANDSGGAGFRLLRVPNA